MCQLPSELVSCEPEGLHYLLLINLVIFIFFLFQFNSSLKWKQSNNNSTTNTFSYGNFHEMLRILHHS